MKNLIIILSFISMTAFSQEPNFPIANKKPKELSIHGHTRIDNYYWLNNRENPDVINYLNQENQYTEQVLAPTKALQETLFAEMKGRIKEQDESVPYKDGNYFYYSRYVLGGEYPVYCRKKGSLDNAEEIIFDCNALAKGHDYYSLGGYEVSDNEQIAAYSEDVVSRRLYTLRFKNLITGEFYPESIENTEGGSIAWATDNKTVFYVLKDTQTLLGFQVYRHVLGTDQKTDVLMYEEKDNQYYMGLYRMKSKKYIAVVSDHNGIASEYNLLEANNPTGAFKPFLARERGHEYSLEHFGDKFYVKTNWQAENYRLMEVSEKESGDKSKWQNLIPHRADVFIDGIEVFKNHLVVAERKEGLMNLRIIHWADKTEHYINFGESTYNARIGYNPDFNSTILRYAYASMTTPNSTFDYEMEAKTKTLLKEQPVLGGFDKNNYVTERLYATAKDGVKVPISIVYRKGTKLDGTSPLLQYAYGSYGANMDASFSSNRLSLLDRGFIFAICHIRGGQEMGRAWYENGKMFKKTNTFTDFIDCSEFLIKNKYSAENQLFAMGGSAGGLLMGAIVNMKPQLYKGVVAAVPFVDVVTTMLDETIPLTTGEWEEWGNPKNKDSYEYMLSYSPYDQVKAQAYPNMMVTTGLHDSQVQYWEPAKWVAKLREMKTDKNTLVLHTNMEAGHGGASGRFSALKEIAMEYAFLLHLAGK